MTIGRTWQVYAERTFVPAVVVRAKDRPNVAYEVRWMRIDSTGKLQLKGTAVSEWEDGGTWASDLVSESETLQWAAADLLAEATDEQRRLERLFP